MTNCKTAKKTFNVQKAVNDCVSWIREWFEENGKGCNAIVGISGGKDSSVVAALCAKALGKDRVIGVLMPNGVQEDIEYAHLLCETLEITNYVYNIKKISDGFYDSLPDGITLTSASKINLGARIRMTALYFVAQSLNGRVANTCNLSEDYVGYATRYGDGAGDFSPCSGFTVEEMKIIGRYLGLPSKLVDKPPIDGLSGKTDEDNLGFTYKTLDDYIRHGVTPDDKTLKKIERLHELNLFKLEYMKCFRFDIDNYYE